jgi:glycosyltransferase involved in cell wall biosynthesis
MISFPFFSICIPTYRQPELLINLLNTINSQTFRDFEVIVSDDSDDDSIEKITENKWSFDIKYFKNIKPLGSPENWNNAINKANGKWIKIMHHDDYFANNNSLLIMYEAISKAIDIDFFYCSTIIHNTKTKENTFYYPNEKYINSLDKIPVNLFFANVIGAPSVSVFKKDLKLKYDKSLIWLVDIEFYSRVLLKYKMQRIPDRLIVTCEEIETQLTTSLKDNKEIELFEFFYCYNKLRPLLNKENKRIFRNVLLDVIDKYKVKSLKDISELKINFLNNNLIYYYIIINFQFSKKILRKLNNIF